MLVSGQLLEMEVLPYQFEPNLPTHAKTIELCQLVDRVGNTGWQAYLHDSFY